MEIIFALFSKKQNLNCESGGNISPPELILICTYTFIFQPLYTILNNVSMLCTSYTCKEEYACTFCPVQCTQYIRKSQGCGRAKISQNISWHIQKCQIIFESSCLCYSLKISNCPVFKQLLAICGTSQPTHFTTSLLFLKG